MTPPEAGFREDAARGFLAPPAEAGDLMACGLPPGLVLDWPQRLIETWRWLLAHHAMLGTHLAACVGCGACAAVCPFGQPGDDPRNLPPARLELAREFERRHLAGGTLRRLGRRPAPPGLDELLAWYAQSQHCTLCRRCAQACPLGVDPAAVTLACREALAAVGLVAAPLARALARSLATGNHLGVGAATWAERCRALEGHLRRTTGQAIPCPVDQAGAEVLLFLPAGEIFAPEGGLAAYAKLFSAAGVSFTTSTLAADAENPGVFLDFRNLRRLARRQRAAARRLRPRLVVFGESGAGFWAAKNFSASLAGDWEREDYLRVKAPLNVLEWAANLVDRGAFHGRLKREVNDRWRVTYHDPCHHARSTGLLVEPRRLLRACCNFFFEMPAATVGAHSLCCGGGGGLAGPEFRELRLKGFAPLAAALTAMHQARDCNLVATACATCRAALLDGLAHYELPLASAGVVELFGQALYPESGAAEART